MKTVSPTALKFASLPGRISFPGHSLTLIVKGTFDLQPNGAATMADEQFFPCGDEFYPKDEEKTGSPRYESDFAFLKLLADLLLVGVCHAPNGRPVVSCPAIFRVGDRSKTVGVLGNRHWEKHWLIWQATEPEPFTRMDLRYENSFGGAKFPANPIGKGAAEVPDGAGGALWPLPNVESPAHLINSRGDRPAPAGFGPLGRTWALRKAKLGTYKGAYHKTRWPWFPEDIDWTHFNAAPPDQQLEGYLHGDERLVFENLHPKHARYESQLPGLRVRCFVNRLTGATSRELRFEEVMMNLDTLWVDMEAEKLVLVWRGWVEVSSEDHEEMQDCYVVTEPLAQSPAGAEIHYREFQTLQTAEGQPFEPETPPPVPSPPVETPDQAVFGAEQEKKKAETRQKLEAQAAAINAQLGVDQLPPALREKTVQMQAKLAEGMAENDPAKLDQLAQEARQQELDGALKKLGLDPKNLPPLSDKARAEQIRLMQELGFDHPGAQGDPQIAELAGIVGAVLGKTAKDPENLESIIAEVRKQKEKLGLNTGPQPAAPTPEAPSLPPLNRESVQAKLAEQGNFEGADLRGLDLSELDLTGADFSGANLAGVPMRKSKLQRANLTEANLAGADLTEADLTNVNAAGADFFVAKLRQATLKEADLAGAKLTKADLTGAVLDEAILEAADLTGACLAESSAIRTLFAHADLTNANFQKVIAVQADFTRATLNRANFQESDLTEAAMVGATGHQINLTGALLTKLRGGGCDFTGAKMIEAKGNGSMWKGANLTGADLRYAKMQEVMFTAACLKQANLSAADLKFGRLNKANLTQAKMVRTNLFQGNLEKANLTESDCTDSNLYEVDFLDAVTDRAVMNGANLLMTKLEPV